MLVATCLALGSSISPVTSWLRDVGSGSTEKPGRHPGNGGGGGGGGGSLGDSPRRPSKPGAGAGGTGGAGGGPYSKPFLGTDDSELRSGFSQRGISVMFKPPFLKDRPIQFRSLQFVLGWHPQSQ